MGADRDAPLDPAVLPDVGRALNLCVRVDLAPLAQPNSGADLETIDLDLHLPVEDVAVDGQVGLDVPDVGPVPVGYVPVDGESLLEHEGEQVSGEVELALIRDEVEHLPLDDVDPGVHRVAEHVTPPGLLQEPLHPAVLAG